MSDKRLKITGIGEFLYKYRAIIAIPFFILLVIFSRPANPQILPFLFILIGVFMRIWASGYIGPQARENIPTTKHTIISGPYYFFKHPLYGGNFFLVLGVIFLFNPPIWFGVLLIILFIFEYALIIMSEVYYLKGLPKKRTKFKLRNVRGEISTIVIMIIIYLIWGQVLKLVIF